MKNLLGDFTESRETDKEWFWPTWTFFKAEKNILRIFWRYWKSIKIKITMTCVNKEYEVHIKMEHELWLLLKIKFLLGYITWKLLFSTEIKALVEDSTAENFPWWRVGWEYFWLVQVDPPHLLSREKPVRACWSWDRGLRHLPHTCVVLEKKFIQEQSSFFWWQKGKGFKSSFDLYFHHLIFKFSWFV